jgi:hypothetical protein
VICLCDFEESEQLMVLPCKHEFHVDCIQPWLLEKSSLCPMCKQDALPRIGGLLPGQESIGGGRIGANGGGGGGGGGGDGGGGGENNRGGNLVTQHMGTLLCRGGRPTYRFCMVLFALMMAVFCVSSLVIFILYF